jgi:hypothetical protein
MGIAWLEIRVSHVFFTPTLQNGSFDHIHWGRDPYSNSTDLLCSYKVLVLVFLYYCKWIFSELL